MINLKYYSILCCEAILTIDFWIQLFDIMFAFCVYWRRALTVNWKYIKLYSEVSNDILKIIDLAKRHGLL